MFDKIPSLKDFIIYFMPGVLTCYFAWDLINHFSGPGFRIADLAGNSVLVFTGILFSFLVGFLTSQAQIILYNAVLRKKLKASQTIHGINWPIELQDSLISEIKKRFGLSGADDELLKQDPGIVFLCEHYVLVKAHANGQRYIDRSKHLASFSCALVLPVVLGVTDLCISFGLQACPTTGIVVVSGTLIALMAGKIMTNFKCGWYADLFRQFLVLSKDAV